MVRIRCLGGLHGPFELVQEFQRFTPDVFCEPRLSCIFGRTTTLSYPLSGALAPGERPNTSMVVGIDGCDLPGTYRGSFS